MATVNEIYIEVADYCLESGGFSSGLWSVQEFLDAYVDVMMDFLQASALYKKIDVQVAGFGTSQYTWSDWAMDIQAIFANEKFVFRGDVEDLDSAYQNWVGKVGTPREWHDDQLGSKISEVFPAPNFNGNQVETTAINGYFGTLSSVTPGDMTITAAAPFFGTVSANAGSTYLESAGPFFGVISQFAETKTNIAAVATATLFNTAITLASPIELIHDSWLPTIKWGVLARLWSKSGDGKSDLQAKYASDKYAEGLRIAKAVSEEGLLDQEAA